MGYLSTKEENLDEFTKSSPIQKLDYTTSLETFEEVGAKPPLQLLSRHSFARTSSTWT